MKLVQHMWESGTLPKDMIWTIFILTPKGKADTREIGMIEILWKVVEAIIKTNIKTVVTFQNVLHGFRIRRGTGTAIMENNMAQDLSSIDQDPLFLVFLYLRKAYDNLYYGRILHTLEGYRSGPKM